MRILAIGLGGAGGRIAEALYANDRKSSKVTCVQALVVDTDAGALTQLRSLPETAKLDFTPVEPEMGFREPDSQNVPLVDVSEILARIQNLERGETDAILVCCGLGGRMAGSVPELVSALRQSVTEPLFALVTLPALSEGERRSARAADDIDAITPILDGIILFDNETWLKKIAPRRDELVEELAKGPGILGLGRNQPKLTPQEITNKLLNQSIIRRISLLLRAGEFRADGGIDLAEVVMDSSEVLNTIKGMGYISIGYAVEHLSHGPLAFLSRLRTSDTTLEQRKSAERIIELAKKAIYQEVSIPCDMTSAAKALILVAGPSHEISMKGFMTVRKWIDRSIAGMEMRSGDYPVTNSENVAIIVVLSGLENIPRITELREIRDQYRGVIPGGSVFTGPSGEASGKTGRSQGIPVSESGTAIRDEMISLSGEKARGKLRRFTEDSDFLTDVSPSGREESVQAIRYEDSKKIIQQTSDAEVRPAAQTSGRSEREERSRSRKPIVSVESTRPVEESRGPAIPYSSRQKEMGKSLSGPISYGERKSPVSENERVVDVKYPQAKARNPDRLAIERDLRIRKRIIKSEIPSGLSGSEPKISVGKNIPREPVRETIPVEKMEKVVLRHRRKEPAPVPEEYEPQKVPSGQEELDTATAKDTSIATPKEPVAKIETRSYSPKDEMFLGKMAPLKEPFRVKDGALLHTEIKPKITRKERDENTEKDDS